MTYLAATAVDLENISILNAGIVAVLGYAVVFFGLILLMLVIMAMGKFFMAQEKKPAAKKEVPAAAPAAPVAAAPVAVPVVADAAPGSAGPVKLYDTPPKTAAMIMAIVANQMGKPLNELRFISIKEVKD